MKWMTLNHRRACSCILCIQSSWILSNLFQLCFFFYSFENIIDLLHIRIKITFVWNHCIFNFKLLDSIKLFYFPLYWSNTTPAKELPACIEWKDWLSDLRFSTPLEHQTEKWRIGWQHAGIISSNRWSCCFS